MFSISQAIRQFKQQWTQQLDDAAIEDACTRAGMIWRKRILPPAYTVKLFLLQILWGNTACNHVPRLADRLFTGAAYCKARARIPLTVLQELLRTGTQSMLAAARDDGLWHGHRLWLVDGTGFSMPDTPELAAHFGYPNNQKPGCGFPVAHALALMHATTGLVQQLLIAPCHTHDMSQVAQLHQHLVAHDLLVGDRGFSSYAHLALLSQRHVFGLMRAHQRLIVDFTPKRSYRLPGTHHSHGTTGRPTSRWVRHLGEEDQIVEWFRPAVQPPWMTLAEYEALPPSLLVRELRYRISPPGWRVREVTLVTTLLDAELYSASELATLYARRWKIETNFAHLKTTLGMDVLHCETVEGVTKEATMFVLVYNLVRMVMREAARLQGVPGDRISFLDTLRWLMTAGPGTKLNHLVLIPNRPGRCEPRVRKRRPKSYPVLNQPRNALRKALLEQSLTH
jgi:hypothetical protein